MIPLVTQARWKISSATQGNKRLKLVKSSKVSVGGSTETQTSMGEDAPVGFIRKPGGHTITLSVLQQQGSPEVEWELLEDTQEVFALTREPVGARRKQYPFCVVSKVEPDDDDEGKHMLEVEIVALERKGL